MYILIILLLIILVLFGVIILKQQKRNKQLLEKKYRLKKEELSIELNKLDDLLKQKQHQLDEFDNRVKDKEAYTDSIIKEKEKRIQEQERHIQHSIRDGQARVDQQVKDYYKLKIKEADIKLDIQIKEQDNLIANYKKEVEQEKTALSADLKKLQDEVEDFRKRRAVINEEILRARALDEQQDFYRIQIDEDALYDIAILLDVRKKLTKRENLDKLIYENYIAKPLQEMAKRVLNGRDPSGIYKITRLKTNEVYIGKSVNVRSRWIQHGKSCFGVGTIAHSILHTTMAKDGIENFTFEFLEEVPKEKLTEREKYWIKFYNTVEYGMNERNG